MRRTHATPGGRPRAWSNDGVGGSGCGQSPPCPSDPALGRDTLRGALDAWKKGETLDGYRRSAPAVTVAERQWRQGLKLLSYEIDGDGKPDGFDVRFRVKLSLQDGGGKPSQERAVYNVRTTPRLVVVRTEAGG